jgi:phage repressor protein C with HTH and peptisase S24 domain
LDHNRIDEQAKRLRTAREMRGFKSAKEAAERHNFVYATYSQHERGQSAITRAAKDYARAFKVSEAWLLTGEGYAPQSTNEIPVMGYLGAGAEVEPEYEQVPPEGLEQIELPFPIPEDLIAFKVKGASMLPVFRYGAVIVVHREQKRPTESFYGEEAAVRTEDGRRFIKTITRGSEANTVNLISFNDAKPIESVRLAWIGEIFTVMPPRSIARVNRQGGIQGQIQLRRVLGE